MNKFEDEPQVEGNDAKELDLEVRRTLSRSPQPYHRKGGSLFLGDNLNLERAKNTSSSPPSIPTSRIESSESGTEADDERGTLLKSLPAPPLRSRKGLRGSTPVNLTPFISPLPTPPAVIQEAGNVFFEIYRRVRGNEVQEPDSKAHDEVYIKRRRGEFIRRWVEILLFGWMALLVWKSSTQQLDIFPWNAEVFNFSLIAGVLYIINPVRSSILVYSTGRSLKQAFRIGFHLPSKFDPGPFMYPVFIPVMISLSLCYEDLAFVPANIVCGLSSIPVSILQVSVGRTRELNCFAWIISVLPFRLAAFISHSKTSPRPLGLNLGANPSISTEDLAALYPLHVSLTSTIHYLTTTSLDASELHLLSTALLNLLLFSRSPQAQILKALFWVGGLCLFMSCKTVLSWEVALARTPIWRLTRNRRRTGGMLAAPDRWICSWILRFWSRDEGLDSSDSEDGQSQNRPPPYRRVLPKMQIQIASDFQSELRSTTVKELTTNGSAESGKIEFKLPFRRNTFATFDSKTKPSTYSDVKGATRPISTNAAFFLSLTVEQARVRKYLYAAFVYVATLLTILIPIRTFVSMNALHSYEPFGWALGYLFGNVQDIRLWVVSNNLEKWISLPDRPRIDLTSEQIGSAEYMRQSYFGAANTRLLLCFYCCIVLLAGIFMVLRLTLVVEVDTRRKGFHGVMVAILLPTIFIDPCFIALALGLILAIFLLLDLFRASQLPPISRPLTHFLAPYVDGRDHRGPVIVSPIFLLIGCAIPLWLSLAGISRTGKNPWYGWDASTRDLSMISGVVCVGMGDAAASLIGRRYGKTKWYWSGGKSLEGSVAFALAVTLGLMFSYCWLRLGGWHVHDHSGIWSAGIKSMFAGVGASLLESTLTAANDNVVVPVALWLLVRGLQI